MENRFNRNILSYGLETFKNIQDGMILVSGMNVIGTETVVNLILSGCNCVGIYDNDIISPSDVSSNFYLTNEDLGKPKCEILKSKLNYLNPNCEIIIETSLDTSVLTKYMLLVQTKPLFHDEITKLNQKCRENHIGFIYSDSYSYLSCIFIDFGDDFTVQNKDGRVPFSYKISKITKSNPGIVEFAAPKDSIIPKSFHGYFSHVQSVPELNEIESVEFTKISGRKYNIIDTTKFSNFDETKDNGFITQIKEKSKLIFKSYDESLETVPQMIVNNERHKWVRNFFLNRQKSQPILLYDQAIGTLIGGLCANEAIKYLTHTYMPIKNQWFVFCLENLFESKSYEEACEKFKEMNPEFIEYDFLKPKTLDFSKEKLLICGIGAVGCTLSKIASTYNPALMSLVDRDDIEISNLNRQLLFSDKDIKKNKAETAKEKLLEYRSNLNINTYPIYITEKTKLKFFSDHTTAFGLVDSFSARGLIAGNAALASIPFFTGGLSPGQGDFECKIPNVTNQYIIRSEPQTTKTCTLRSFPYKKEHCIEWATEFLIKVINSSGYKTIDECIDYAKNKFRSKFYIYWQNNIILHPKDEIRNGEPYWSGTRIFPKTIKYDKTNELHKKFIISLTKLLAAASNIPLPTDEDLMAKINDISIIYPTDEEISNHKKELKEVSKEKPKRTHMFDEYNKDQVDLLMSSSNLRSLIFNLPEITESDCIKFAGKIVPVVSTINSIVSSNIWLIYMDYLANPDFGYTGTFYSENCSIRYAKQTRLNNPRKFGNTERLFYGWEYFRFDSKTKLGEVLQNLKEQLKCGIDSWATRTGTLPLDKPDLTFEDVIHPDTDYAIVEPLPEGDFDCPSILVTFE
ncbi:ThiF family protein [Trichomonas vaginalis G3]|uniref:NEDD8-activating enzyme E1 catalytic subunit n=1 Tax=Trichomonas vaginalis (strain ATCC PRA-98 / G3) TaxID=412133 RepID=A2E8P8_TRIV3|nr:ubiquitin-activating enzyme E1 family [Trichomonas vaginalis G3]EAY10987.1 ThiF family protein [Trichomonas vaginalis G3]KAI5530813.1 ubiquitin-activating enzyme E1 family [Trichomonas vaginalis G3]|eukprot:XP_001323210.1 ThiF family protein [Trichomonas vaginalis G3]